MASLLPSLQNYSVLNVSFEGVDRFHVQTMMGCVSFAAPADSVLNYLTQKHWTGLAELQIPQAVRCCPLPTFQWPACFHSTYHTIMGARCPLVGKCLAKPLISRPPVLRDVQTVWMEGW